MPNKSSTDSYLDRIATGLEKNAGIEPKDGDSGRATTFAYLDRIATALESEAKSEENDKKRGSTFAYLDRIATAVENGAGKIPATGKSPRLIVTIDNRDGSIPVDFYSSYDFYIPSTANIPIRSIKATEYTYIVNIGEIDSFGVLYEDIEDAYGDHFITSMLSSEIFSGFVQYTNYFTKNMENCFIASKTLDYGNGDIEELNFLVPIDQTKDSLVEIYAKGTLLFSDSIQVSTGLVPFAAGYLWDDIINMDYKSIIVKYGGVEYTIPQDSAQDNYSGHMFFGESFGGYYGSPNFGVSFANYPVYLASIDGRYSAVFMEEVGTHYIVLIGNEPLQ